VALRRFFVDPQDLNNSVLRVSGDLFHHIRDVCRFVVGDHFEVLTGQGKAWQVEITEIGKKELIAKELSSRELPPPAKPEVNLAISIPKLPKMDWIIEKSVELGVAGIYPFVSDYSFLRKTSEISPNRQERWLKLIHGATQQSGRGDLMALGEVRHIDQLLREINLSDHVGGLFPYEGPSQLGLRPALAELKGRSIDTLWVFVGSEGGFSLREVDLFKAKGLNTVSMGEQILRVETACVAIVSVIKYEFGTLC
jgi:16S rRNA (uracil1498-N3)-methyltransferase